MKALFIFSLITERVSITDKVRVQAVLLARYPAGEVIACSGAGLLAGLATRAANRLALPAFLHSPASILVSEHTAVIIRIITIIIIIMGIRVYSVSSSRTEVMTVISSKSGAVCGDHLVRHVRTGPSPDIIIHTEVIPGDITINIVCKNW